MITAPLNQMMQMMQQKFGQQAVPQRNEQMMPQLYQNMMQGWNPQGYRAYADSFYDMLNAPRAVPPLPPVSSPAAPAPTQSAARDPRSFQNPTLDPNYHG